MIADAIIKAKPTEVMKLAHSFLRRIINEENAKGTRIMPTATVIAIWDSLGSRWNPYEQPLGSKLKIEKSDAIKAIEKKIKIAPIIPALIDNNG